MKRRSQLYVPGVNEKMVQKSLQIPADSIIFDLEDSVPPEDKQKAREIIKRNLVNDWGNRELCVRINSISDKEGMKDILFFSDLEKIDLFLVPKAESDLSFVHKATGKRLEPIIETPRGLVKLEEIVRSEGVVALTYGAADLALHSLGQVRGYEKNTSLMLEIVSVARAYDVEPIDKVYFDLKNTLGFKEEAEIAKALGFSGKQVIHPSQVELANQVFSPSPEEMAWYKEIVEAYERAIKEGRGAIRLRDQLIDNVHYKIAKRYIQDFP
ncbi:CoA ester lyase [Metallosphaera tengchongensis]|uniref:CoA ester lyase n=1 Tax=Metallosphaera tengchongensis TaxID=1532350 RepID=A0A6N0NU00_9CREN|nr:CoA ester lyase [Metallosphaera tengchongensis]QKR00182.1 CoA ester lyase [Metallosphaera tengchongensis]